MKKPALLLAVATALTLTAINSATAQGNSRVYIMKKDGKLTEVINGTKEAVSRDVTLPNKATVHPDGSVDDKDGNKRQLGEGEYISFVDGRIRKLSASPAASTAATASTRSASSKPVKSATTKKPTNK